MALTPDQRRRLYDALRHTYEPAAFVQRYGEAPLRPASRPARSYALRWNAQRDDPRRSPARRAADTVPVQSAGSRVSVRSVGTSANCRAGTSRIHPLFAAVELNGQPK